MPHTETETNCRSVPTKCEHLDLVGTNFGQRRRVWRRLAKFFDFHHERTRNSWGEEDGPLCPCAKGASASLALFNLVAADADVAITIHDEGLPARIDEHFDPPGWKEVGDDRPLAGALGLRERIARVVQRGLGRAVSQNDAQLVRFVRPDRRAVGVLPAAAHDPAFLRV